MKYRKGWLKFGATLLLAVSACSSSSEPASATVTGKVGDAGLLSFDFAPESELAQGENTFRLAVHDAKTAAPFAGANVTVEASMPAMDHDSNGIVTDAGSGAYKVTKIVFVMSGTWEIALSAEKSGVSDKTVIKYEVP